MDVRFEMQNNILIAELKGELDHHSAGAVRLEIDRTMEAFSAKNLILSFQGVSFMDSAGIGMVAGRYKKVNELGGLVYVVGCSEYVRRILGMAGIFMLMGVAETAEKAATLIGETEQEGPAHHEDGCGSGGETREEMRRERKEAEK